MTVLGPGGVGKTRLTREWMRRAGLDATFCDLTEVTSGPGLVATVAESLGVGRDAVEPALSRGKRVLVAMCNAKERLSRLLETEPIGPRNRRIRPNIDAVNMIPRVALEEYGMMVLRVKTLYRAIFENRFVSALLRGIPGIEAWSLLGKAYFHVHEQDSRGRPRYDLVILDAPATGHDASTNALIDHCNAMRRGD